MLHSYLNFYKKTSWIYALAFLLCGTSLRAQVATNYVFSQSTGTYTPITGGTLLGSTTSDDQRFIDPATPAGGTTTTGVGLPIGFTFSYNGQSYDRFAINNNGWITFGSSSLTPAININSSSSYNPLSATSTASPAHLRNRLAVLGNDLQAQTGSTLRYETLGSTPNRVLVIQWSNYRNWNATGENLNFQIRLTETANTIQFVYGTMTASTNFTFHVGLGGSVNTDFNNRTTTTNWASSTAGTANTSAMTLSSTVFPASGLIFTWALPPEINLLGTDNSTIVSGTTTTATVNGTDFGAVSVASGITVSRTFTIQNAGSGIGPLTTSTVTSSNVSFSITQQPSATVAPNDNTTFTVRFNPTTSGTFTSTISIPNNDTNENPYTFRVTGSATAPDINVVGLGNNINNNKFLTTSTDGTFLGVVSGSTTLSSTFTIQNTGNEALTVSGISMRRGSNSAFSVANVPTNIAAAGSADFTISYNASKGSQADTVAIASNDGDEAIYLFAVSAGGVVAALDNNLANGDLLISPNPSSKNFNIKIGGSKYTSVNAVVYDMAGRTVKAQNVAQFTGSLDIDLGNLEKGTYILMLETGGEKVARKLIKQ